MAGDNACIITGGANVSFCSAMRTWLAKYMYKNTGDYDKYGYGTKATNMCEKYWDKTFSPLKDSNPDEGVILGQLFEAKDKSLGACDPVVAFRGTRFADTQGLLLVVTITIEGIKYYFGVRGTGNGDYDFLHSRSHPDTTGFDNMLHFEESVTLDVASPFNFFQRIGCNCSLSFDFYASQNGDWATNIQQGLGKPSQKYKDAIKYGSNCLKYLTPKIAETKARTFRQPKVYFCGHSLGGGLATAAMTANAKFFPQLDITANIYNSAGVHGHTVGQTHTTASPCGSVAAFSVQNEILTTIQSDVKDLPIIGTVFKIFDFELPAAPCVPSRTTAVDPASKKALPGILPLDVNKYPKLVALDNALSPATSVYHFFHYLLGYLWQQKDLLLESEWSSPYNTPAKPTALEDLLRIIGSDNDISDLTAELTQREINSAIEVFTDVLPKLFSEDCSPVFGDSIDRHGMDYVIASYEAKTGIYLK